MLEGEALEYAHRWLRAEVEKMKRREESRRFYAKLEKEKKQRVLAAVKARARSTSLE